MFPHACIVPFIPGVQACFAAQGEPVFGLLEVWQPASGGVVAIELRVAPKDAEFCKEQLYRGKPHPVGVGPTVMVKLMLAVPAVGVAESVTVTV